MEFFADEENVKVYGRTLRIDNTRFINYTCSGIEFWFTGKKVCAELEAHWYTDENVKDIFMGWVAVFVNDEMTQRFRLEKELDLYTLFESENEQTVKIRLTKLSEEAFGKVGIRRLITDNDKPLIPTAKRSRTIEFVGDSITCGYGVEGKLNVDNFNTTQENPLKAYAYLTGQTLDADCNFVSWSGIGIISNWVAEDVNEPYTQWLMPMLYQYTDAGYCNDIGQKPFESWDFTRFTPQLIVVNIGTNDDSYTRGIPEREQSYCDEYGKFVRYIREKNPDSEILCCYGIMGDRLFPMIDKMVRETGDPRIHALKFDVQNEFDGYAADSHPSAITQRRAAMKLTDEIRRIMGW